MGQLFSKSKPKSRVTDEDKAILQLKMERDNLKIMVKRYEKTIAKDKQIAKELLRKEQRDRALLLLKKKRFGESIIERVEKHLSKIEEMIVDIEMAQTNREVIEKLHEGSRALQTVNRAFSIEEVEKIMLETQEGIDVQNEITNIISGQLNDTELDAVEEEFDELLRAEMPNVPEDELEAIKEEAGIPAKKERKREATAVEAM